VLYSLTAEGEEFPRTTRWIRGALEGALRARGCDPVLLSEETPAQRVDGAAWYHGTALLIRVGNGAGAQEEVGEGGGGDGDVGEAEGEEGVAVGLEDAGGDAVGEEGPGGLRARGGRGHTYHLRGKSRRGPEKVQDIRLGGDRRGGGRSVRAPAGGVAPGRFCEVGMEGPGDGGDGLDPASERRRAGSGYPCAC
jgi:hypothetical protein